jgi:hypothetical protein
LSPWRPASSLSVIIRYVPSGFQQQLWSEKGRDLDEKLIKDEEKEKKNWTLTGDTKPLHFWDFQV